MELEKCGVQELKADLEDLKGKVDNQVHHKGINVTNETTNLTSK
jgi:hypothetical protein